MSECITFAARAAPAVSADQMAEHEGLVRWVVRRQWLGAMPFDDALHEGRIGLWSALRHYDPRRGTTFSTYAVPAIAHAVWRAVAVDAHHSSSPHVLPIPSAPTDPVDLVHRAQVELALVDLVDSLPPHLHEVIVNHYGLGDHLPETFAAIGQRVGVTRQRIQQRHVGAILWLAHPAHSLPLRRLLDRHRRADYQQALARQRKASQQRRPSPPVGRRRTSRRPICSS